MKIRYTIRLKIIALTALLLAPVASYGIYHYSELVEHDTWHTRLLNREVTADGARMFDDLVERTFALLRAVGRHPAATGAERTALDRLLAGSLAGEPHVRTILVIGRNGRVLGGASGIPSEGVIDFRNHGWLREALRGPVVGPYELFPGTNIPMIMVASPLRDHRGALVGVVAAPLHLEFIGNALTRGLLLQDRAFLQVVDGNDAVVLDSRGRPDGRRTGYPPAAADGVVVEDSGGNQVLLSTMPMMYGGLKSVVGMPLQEAYRDARRFGERFLAAFLALGFLTVLSGWIFARRLGRRIDALITGIGEMEQGNLSARLLPEGSDELRYVAERFNAMADARKRAEADRDMLISELTDNVQQVSRAKQEWKATFDAITDPVSIHDLEYRVIRANRAFSEQVGLDPASVANRKCYEMVHHSCGPLENCPHTATMRGVLPCSREVSDPRTNRIFQITTFPYFGEGSELLGSVHISKDITEKKDQERSLAMSERFAALGRMASGIAHEINNPLAAVSGCAEGLLTRIERNAIEPEMFRRYLTIIQEEVFRCKSITSSMLSFTRKESCERKHLDLREVIRKSIELIGFQGRLKNVRVVFDFAADLPPVFGSEGELRQVFLTLVTNALDAMQEKGALTVRAEAAGNGLRVTVQDTGPGIAPEHLERLFEPFFTTKADQGGNGLGLSIANRIVINHQGALKAESCAGGGALFTLVLPAASLEREELCL